VRAISAAQFCTGIARHGFEQWFPRYLVEVHGLRVEGAAFQQGALAVVGAGVLGAVLAGRLSDGVFRGRRAPAAFVGYALQIAGCGVIASTRDLSWIVPAFMGHAVGIAIVHAMLAGTAPMDFGGRSGAATVAGVFDGAHYLGGAISGAGLGMLVDRAGWAAWAPAMIGTSTLGLLLMLHLWQAAPPAHSRDASA
jgi:OPA family glycerol-3-phosphate transporter-like MFS transporter